MMKKLAGSVVVLLLICSQEAASQLANCFISGTECRGSNPISTTIEECCSSPNTPRSYQRRGGEDCEPCQFTYRCFLDECDDADFSIPDNETTTTVINDGERVCCSSGQYHSWTELAVDSHSCNPCPVIESTTANDHELTTATPSKSTILPKVTVQVLTGQGAKPDSESQPQNPMSNRVDQSSGSRRCIAGTVVVTTLLAIVTFIH